MSSVRVIYALRLEGLPNVKFGLFGLLNFAKPLEKAKDIRFLEMILLPKIFTPDHTYGGEICTKKSLLQPRPNCKGYQQQLLLVT